MKKLHFIIVVLLFIRTPVVLGLDIKGEKEVPVTVTVLSDYRLRTIIPSDFLGFSYEMSQLTDNSRYLHPDNLVLIQMMKNLGNGVLRLGGNSSDKISWTGMPRIDYMRKDSLTTTDVDTFSKFVDLTGWKVIWGLNLGENNPEKNSDEAVYVAKRLKNALYALQIGNEPDLYYKHLRPVNYAISDYEKEWFLHYTKIKERLPDITIAGPAVAGDIRWFESFLNSYSSRISLMTGHYYNSPGKNATVNWKTILEPDNHLSGYLQVLNFLCQKHGITYRMAECNTVSQGGKIGVSNVFASALWALDYMWSVALNNGVGVNFHGGSVSKYAPIVVDEKGIPTPRPIYYAMLAFKYGSEGGNIVPSVISPSVPNSSVYACVNGKTLKVTLLNKSEDDISFTVRLNDTPASVQLLRLTAPSPISSSGIRFADAEVEADGSFQLNMREKYQPQNEYVKVSVPAMSAAVMIIDKE